MAASGTTRLAWMLRPNSSKNVLAFCFILDTPLSLQIIQYPHPTLRHRSKPLRRVDAELRKIIEEMFGQFAAAPGVRGPSRLTQELLATMRDVVGEDAWPSIRANLQGLMQLRTEPVLLMDPGVIVVR